MAGIRDTLRHRGKLPEGTTIRAFGVRVEEIINAYYLGMKYPH
jgi:hypothetical protein